MKHIKRFTALVLALVMVFSLTTGASAAGAENVKVQLSPNITVTYNGEPQTMVDVNGNPVYPILNGGTTYLPIRAVGNMLGLDVDWDGATQTVLLNKSADGEATPAKSGNATASDSAPTEITAQINPGITVKYNGKAQTMADVNGNPVYPMLYGGTTYLPVRAVSNMLGIAVDWDGATQTVILGETGTDETPKANDPITLTTKDKSGNDVTVTGTSAEEIRKALETANVEDTTIEFLMRMVGGFTNPEEYDKTNHVAEMKTSTDAKILGDNHIGYDWCEIDWNNADDGYVRIKINEQTTSHTVCRVRWYEDEIEGQGDRHNKSDSYSIPEGRWVNIPLIGNATDFAVIIEQGWTADEVSAIQNAHDNAKTEAELKEIDAIYRNTLTARFTGKTISEDARWLLSHANLDFENAPLTYAKALEITKNCKTDAEKITAVFNWVASNIKYDYVKYEKDIAQTIAVRTGQSTFDPLSTPARELDDILTTKSGVCEDYARLMTGMLRSVGIPCKYVSGEVYDGKIIEGYNDNNPGWMGHAWVAVNPQSGELNMKALGGGKDFAPTKIGEMDNENPTGWIRLDPTWGNTASGRADAAIDKNHRTADYY